MSELQTKIRIVATPSGEAPLWVREKWIGLELPLVRPLAANVPVFGVTSGPRTISREVWSQIIGRSKKANGYVVEVTKAIDILEGSSPQAAAWWRENTPHLFRSRRFLLFDIEACRVI